MAEFAGHALGARNRLPVRHHRGRDASADHHHHGVRELSRRTETRLGEARRPHVMAARHRQGVPFGETRPQRDIAPAKIGREEDVAGALVHPRRDEPDRMRRHPERRPRREATTDKAVQPRESRLAHRAKGGRGIGEEP